jgi:hypothetical protein
MSHRKAFSHAVPQAWLARKLEPTVPSPPPLSQLLRSDSIIASRPNLRRFGVAVEFPIYRRPRPAECNRNLVLRYTACMQAVYLNALFKAELAITLSHRDNTFSRCCTCLVSPGTIQYAVTSLFDLFCRGVLDAPPARSMTALEMARSQSILRRPNSWNGVLEFLSRFVRDAPDFKPPHALPPPAQQALRRACRGRAA